MMKIIDFWIGNFYLSLVISEVHTTLWCVKTHQKHLKYVVWTQINDNVGNGMQLCL